MGLSTTPSMLVVKMQIYLDRIVSAAKLDVNLYEEVSVNEKITLINEYLDQKKEFYFNELITNPDSIMEIVCSFLAILELAKSSNIVFFQNRLFGDIKITRYSEDISSGTD